MNKLKSLFSLILIICITISVSGCASNNKTTAGDNDNNNQQNNSSSVVANPNITVTKAYDFSEGLAWAEFSNNGVDYYGIINTQGKIIYENPYDNQSKYNFYAFSGGMSYYSRDEACYLVGSDGKVIASSEAGDFDEILAEGDGLAWVFKDNSGVSATEYLYGVLDKNGNWVQPLTDFVYKFLGSSFYYAGSGMFVHIKDNGFDFYNSSNNTIISLSNSEEDIVHASIYTQYFLHGELCFFTNNNAYFQPNDNEYWITGLKYLEGTDLSKLNDVQAKGIKSCFAVNTDGTYTEIPDYVMESEGKLLRENGDHCEIYDYASGKSAQLSKYGIDMIERMAFNGDYGLLVIKGKDGNKYFTLIDTNGTEKFEPIKCYWIDVSYSNSKIIAETEDNVFSIYDENGAVLAEGLNYKQIDGFSDGIAVAVDEDSNTCYINSKGEKILTNLSE